MLRVEGRDYLQPCKQGDRLLEVLQGGGFVGRAVLARLRVPGVEIRQSLDRLRAYDCGYFADSQR